MTPMPASVRIGPHVYSILRKPAAAMPNSWGSCDNGTLQIWVRQRLKLSKSKEILLHEVFHACLHSSVNGGSYNEEEDFVEALSPALLQVIQDNPELLEYLTQ